MLGQRLADRYEILSELGRGGMGVVYRAHDPMLDRDVAVKVIPPAQLSRENEQRFQREARVVAQMDHPNIVPIYDFGRDDDSLFLVMPVLPGTSLRALLQDRDLVLGDAIDIGIQAADALAYSHASDVVHRDIKPENIMVAREANGELRVRVMDFGLARATSRTRLTKTGVLVGTMAYLSPEQVVAREIDARSDLYSLGTVLYECIVGQPPFGGELQSILYRIAHEHPAPPRALGVEIGPDLEKILLKCLAKEPGDRIQRAADLVDALRRVRAHLGDSDRTKSVMVSELGPQRPVLAPFVGREQELSELQQRLGTAIAGECQLVLVGGEAGVGKTRLLDEIEGLARARGVRVLHGRFVELDRSFPYQGFCEVIQEFFRRSESGSASSQPSDLSDIAADLVALFPMLAEIDSIRAAAGEGEAFQGSDDRTRVFEVLARALTRIGGGRPLVLLLENLHDAEISLEALQYVVRRLGPTPTLIVGTYRTSDVDRRHPLATLLDAFQGDRRFTSLLLEPFTGSEHKRFLETLIGGPAMADELVERLFEATEGNAFFAKELVRSLLDSGGIDKDRTGKWRLSGEVGITTDALPATIQQAVERRVEKLPEDLRHVLRIAAVIGRTCDFRDLEALAPDAIDVDDAVDRLIQEGILEEDRKSRGDRLHFASGVVRDVLYGRISRRKRRTLHRRCGEQLEQRQRGRLERAYADLLYHFYEGDVPDKTVEYGLLLAQRSLDAFSPDEAIRATRAALDFLDEEWEGDRSLEGAARLLLARAHRLGGDIDAAMQQVGAAVGVLTAVGAPAAEALVFAAETAWQGRRTDDTVRWIERGLDATREAGDREAQRRLLHLGATIANQRGEHARAGEYLAEAGRLGAAEQPDAEEAEPGGRIVVPFPAPLRAAEPGDAELNEESEVLANVFETLIDSDAEGNLVPALASSWRVREDGRSVGIVLRKDVKFHDGSPFTAADVQRSFERSIRRRPDRLGPAHAAIEGAAAFAAGETDGLEGVTLRSDHELDVRLADPLPIYPALLSDPRAAVVREVEEGRIHGTGPFRIEAREPDRVVVARNDHYAGTRPLLDEIEFRGGIPAAALAAGLRAGEFDIGRDLRPSDIDELLQDRRFRAGFVEAPKSNTYFVLFNTARGGTADPTVRRALAGVIRTRDIVWRTLGRHAMPAACFQPPGILGHDAGHRRPVLDPGEAQRLLAEAGVAPPLRLRAAVHPLYHDRCRGLLDALLAAWAEIGVEVAVESDSMAGFLELIDAAEVDLVVARQNPDYEDPDFMTRGLFHSRDGLLRKFFGSHETDLILDAARTERRREARDRLYKEFEGRLAEAAAVLPLFHDVDYRIAASGVHGLNLRGKHPFVDYARLGRRKTPAAAPARAARGGVIQVPVQATMESIDPALSWTTTQTETLLNVFETLTRDVGAAQIVPHLAADIRTEDGGRRYRFRLRDGVRFHDGRRLTARDVRWSFERFLANPACVQRWMLSSIRGADALTRGATKELSGFQIHSARTFTLDLKEPLSFLPAVLSYTSLAIVPEGADVFDGNWKTGCAGTGPYRIARFEPGRVLELERNPSYWRRGYPCNEGLVFSFGTSLPDALAGFRAGRFSMASALQPADWESLRRDPEYASSYREAPQLVTNYLAFNLNRPPLDDRSVRERIVRAIDVAELLHGSGERLAMPAVGLTPPGLLGHSSTPPHRPAVTPSDPAETLRLRVVANSLYLEGRYAAMARRMWRQLGAAGIEVEYANQSGEELGQFTEDGKADLYLSGWVADYPDTDSFLYGLLHTKKGLLRKYCGAPEIDRLVERARAETDPRVRHGLYVEAENAIAKEALLVPLFHQHTYRFVRPEIEGLALAYSPEVNYEELRVRS